MRLLILLAAILQCGFGAVKLPEGVRFDTGAANVVRVGPATAVYGVPGETRGPVRVLLTHARRDVFSGGARAGVTFAVPAAERELFENPARFWAALETGRFHDYAQLGTKVPVEPITIAQGVADGDALNEGKTIIRVIGTPGYTPGAVSYLIEAGGKRIACTGDLIYGNGQLFDLYSLQDAVPEAKARGYHGYAARAGELIASLRKIAAARPDVILPARGPAIENPEASIGLLIRRLQTFLASHYGVDALRWYWGDDNHRIRSRAVERGMDIMPMAEQADLPADIIAIGNSRLIVSRTKSAFLVDAGFRNLLPELRKLRDAGVIRGIDGIWITHYHDDHTNHINEVRAEFGSPVYFTHRMAEVMGNPGSFRLPCLTTEAVPVEGARKDGETLRWNEWQFSFWHFPGQTLYHGGLIAQRDGDTYLFAGDSFTPSGMDDYCMQNRVILRAGEGYDACLRKIASLPRGAWVINQHVRPLFRYTGEQVERMQRELTARSATLAELSPWPDINYMVDESWSRIHPYGSEASAGVTVELELRILNHAPKAMRYDIGWNAPAGWRIVDAQKSITIAARQEGKTRVRVHTGGSGLHVLTADISFDGRVLRNWTEALVRVR
jgi:glyoxylase-like metal-dependent hydrolase (beta-lactamase superfamily II)